MTNDRPPFFDEGLVTEFDSVEQNLTRGAQTEWDHISQHCVHQDHCLQ